MFVFAKKHFGLAKASLKLRKVIIALSKYSFGAYLFHDMAISSLKIAGLNTLTFNPVLSIPVIGIIVFFFSYSVSAILNHIPILKKCVV